MLEDCNCGRETGGARVERLEQRQLLSAATVTTIKSTVAHPTFGQTVEFVVKVATTKGKLATEGTVELFANKVYSGFSAEVSSTGIAKFLFSPGDALAIANDVLYAHYQTNHRFGGSTSKKIDVAIVTPTGLTTSSDGLMTKTITAGSGAAVVAREVVVTFEDTVYDSTGKVIAESSVHKPAYGTLTVDATPEQTVAGLDEGLIGMQVGEVRVIVVPSALAYNDGRTLYAVIELRSITG